MGIILGVVVARSAAIGATYSQYTLNPPVANTTASTSPYTTLKVGTQSIFASGWSAQTTNAIGQAVLLADDGTTTNQEAVLFDPANSSAGFVVVGPTSIKNNQGYFEQSVAGLSAAGAVAGISIDSTGNGNAWVYTPSAGATVIANTGGLTSSTYNFSSGGNTYFNEFASAVAGVGYTVGIAQREGGSNSTTTVGQDVWLYNPNNPSAGAVIIPLIDSTDYVETVFTSDSSYTNHNYQFSSVQAVNASGTAVGASSRYLGGSSTNGYFSSYGSDSWMYKGGITTQIGLIGALSGTGGVTLTNSGTEFSQTYGINDSGQISGHSAAYQTSSGISQGSYFTWIYTPSSTPGTASGLYFNSATDNSFSANNYISGSYGTYQRVGLTDSGHVNALGFDGSSVAVLNANGQASGYSNRYSNGVGEGQDIWYFSGVKGSASQLVAPTATSSSYSYININGSRSSSITQMNSNGFIAGFTTRYVPGTTTSLGSDAFVYDPTGSGTTYVVDINAGATGNYASSRIQYLSNSGIAIGTYSTYADTSSTPTGTYLFEWYEDGTSTGKFITLNTALTNPSLASASFSALASMLTIGNNGTLYGLGTTTSSAQALFSLTPALLGDANLDGRVDLTDLNIVLNHLGTTDSARADGNFDGAATIDLTDLNDVLNNLGTTLSASELAAAVSAEASLGAVTATPEPATAAVLLMAGAMTLIRRRRPVNG